MNEGAGFHVQCTTAKEMILTDGEESKFGLRGKRSGHELTNEEY